MRLGSRWLRWLPCAACVVAALGVVASCEIPTAPPANARRVAALPTYATWWREVEQCSALTADPARVEWYEVPADPADGGFYCEDGPDQTCAGEWVAPHAVYLAGPSPEYPLGYAVDEWTVKHEMLHDLIGRPGHPQVFDDCRLDSRTPNGIYGLNR